MGNKRASVSIEVELFHIWTTFFEYKYSYFTIFLDDLFSTDKLTEQKYLVII